jgi:hypothetical protein
VAGAAESLFNAFHSRSIHHRKRMASRWIAPLGQIEPEPE